MKKFLFSCMLGCMLTAGTHAAMPVGITMDKSGQLKVGGLEAAVRIYDAKWKRSGQNSIKPESGYPVMSGDIYEVKGDWPLPGENSGFYVEEKMSAVASDKVKYTMSLTHREGARVKLIALCVELPIYRFGGKKIWIDDKEMVLPKNEEKIPELGKIKKITIANDGNNISFEGAFTAELADMRHSQQPMFHLRIYFTPSTGKILESSLNLNIGIKADTCMLPLKDVPKAVSGKGAAALFERFGLAQKKEGFNVGGVSFAPDSVLDINAAGKAVVAVPKTGEVKYLYLLHNADGNASRPCLALHYQDGSKQEITLRRDVDFSSAKPLGRIANGALISSNNKTFEGLYYSVFPLDKAGLNQITFTNDSGNWYIAAATLGTNKILSADVNSIYYLQEDADWARMETMVQPEKGSVLDFSSMLEAPAGKNGWLKVDREGHFYAANVPGKQVRLWGANLDSDSLILEKAEAEKLADELAACGYNTIRLHHIEKATVDRTQDDSRIFDKEKLDKMDYLFYCLKKRGMYITVDLYCTRRIQKKEDRETKGVLPNGNRKIKQHIRLTPEGRSNWKDFTRNFLTHVNPYTGMAWAQDPALFGIVLINEDFPYNFNDSPALKSRELDGYKKYLEKMNLFSKENFEARGKLYDAYANESYIAMYQDLSSFMRNEIKYNGLLSSMNFNEYLAQNYIRDAFDFVDNHAYWDHPNFSFSRQVLPRYHSQGNILKYDLWCPRRQFPARIFGKPYTMTELNYCFPNRYRANFGPVIGAYGALQNWDAMYRFDWATFRAQVLKQTPIQNFDIAQDAISQMADRVVSLMFLRADVESSKSAVALTYGPKSWEQFKETERPSAINCPEELTKLGFYCQIGAIREDLNLPGVIKLQNPDSFMTQLSAAERQALTAQVKTSETRQIVYDHSAATLKVVTPKTESLTLDSGKLSGKVLSISGADTFQSITAASLDGQPLASSKKIILFHLSNVVNKYMRFTSTDMCTVEDWGSKEQLIRRAKINIELGTAGNVCSVRAIGLNGNPKGDIPAQLGNKVLRFTADTAAFNGTMVYLIEIQ